MYMTDAVERFFNVIEGDMKIRKESPRKIYVLILLLFSACSVSTEKMESVAENRTPVPKPEVIASPIRESGVQALVEFIFNSEYIVLAKCEKLDPVALVDRSETNSNVVNLGELAAGTLFSFRVQKNLFSANKNNTNDPLSITFQIFGKTGNLAEHYKVGNNYLIFLNKIPEESDLFSIYSLDRKQTYFAAHDGSSSFFSTSTDPHSASSKGILDLSNPAHRSLSRVIITITNALDERSSKKQLSNLDRLRSSKDQEIRNLTELVIEKLEEEKGNAPNL